MALFCWLDSNGNSRTGLDHKLPELIAKFKLWKNQLGLFLDQHDAWRCGGRLTKVNLPYVQTHSILLPTQHPLTVLIVKSAHDWTLHGGVKDTLTEVRSKCWLVKGRQFVKKIIHQLVTYKTLTTEQCLHCHCQISIWLKHYHFCTNVM